MNVRLLFVPLLLLIASEFYLIWERNPCNIRGEVNNYSLGNYTCYQAGKLVVYYFGLENDSFSAREKIAFVEATSKFGRWKGLGTFDMPDLVTYSLRNASFEGDIVVKAYDVDVQAISDEEKELLYNYSGAFVPLVIIGCRYYRVGVYPDYFMFGVNEKALEREERSIRKYICELRRH